MPIDLCQRHASAFTCSRCRTATADRTSATPWGFPPGAAKWPRANALLLIATVNAFAPGLTLTDMSVALLPFWFNPLDIRRAGRSELGACRA